MADFFSWFQVNWSSFIGAAGIIGGLYFTSMTTRENSKVVREDCRARQVQNLLGMDERHDKLWKEAQERPDLKRILAEKVDLKNEPLTVEEDIFLRRVIRFLETGWRLEKIMDRGELDILAKDVAAFLRHPLPQTVWKSVREFRNPEFVTFVEQAIEQGGRFSE